MDNDIFKNEIFEELDPEQIQALKALYSRIKGKSPERILPIIMSFKMPAGKPLTNEQKQKLMALLMQQLGQGKL